MPMSFAEALKKDIDKIQFVTEQAKVTKKKKKKDKSPATDISIKRGMDLKLIIRNAAINLFQISITYRKDTTGEVKRYRVAPYEWKSRKLKSGFRRVLYAYDMDDKHIKSFVGRNILKVETLEKRFRPKWPIMIA